MATQWSTLEPAGDPLESFERERRHLLAVAFRILGSDADAQDVLQEAWIRFEQADRRAVRNVAAWLTTVVTRLCLDLLRRRHEYPHEPGSLPLAGGGQDEAPEEVVLLAAELAEAFTVVLGRLTPNQRVALILHDAFGRSFAEVARMLDTTPEGAKKLASRARGRVRELVGPPEVDPAAARRLVAEFLRAARQGDLEALAAVLHPEVTRTADPHVLPSQGAQRLRGVEAVARETRMFQANARRARLATIDGRPGIVVASGGETALALVFAIAGERIVAYDVVADPERLALLRVEA